MMNAESQGGGGKNKKLLESLLYSNSDRLVIKANDKGKNPYIWSQYQIAYLDGVEQKYALCIFCRTFIKYTGRTGTGGLMRHLCFRRMNEMKCLRKHATDANRTGKNRARMSVKMQLEDLMNWNSPRIGYVKNAKGKSKIWSQFRILTVDNAVSKYACCMLCRSIVTYRGRTGTGSMVRHKCSKNRLVKRRDTDENADEASPYPDRVHSVIKVEETLDLDDNELSGDRDIVTGASFLGDEGEFKTEMDDEECRIPKDVDKILQEKHAAFLNRSLRFFDVFESEEFLDLAQFLVNLGAQLGPIDVRNIFRQKINFGNVE